MADAVGVPHRLGRLRRPLRRGNARLDLKQYCIVSLPRQDDASDVVVQARNLAEDMQHLSVELRKRGKRASRTVFP